MNKINDLISRQAAIDAVKAYWKKVVDDIPKGVGFEEMTQLCNMALEHNANILKAIDQLPSAQPELIRCKDCKHWDGVDTCDVIDAPVWDNDFCSVAERRSDE